jgi:hypothetical protein
LIASLRLAFGRATRRDATREHVVGAQAANIFASESVKPRLIARTLRTMHAQLPTPNQRIWAQGLGWAGQGSRTTTCNAPVEDEQSSLWLAKRWEHAFPQELASLAMPRAVNHNGSCKSSSRWFFISTRVLYTSAHTLMSVLWCYIIG